MAGVRFLKDHGATTISALSDEALDTPCGVVIYTIRPQVSSIKAVIGHIRDHRARSISKTYVCYFVPRINVSCSEYLEKEGYFDAIMTFPLPLYLFPLDGDFASMELPRASRDLFLRRDRSLLHHVAECLFQLEILCGRFDRISGKGALAMQAVEALKCVRRQSASAKDVHTRAGMDSPSASQHLPTFLAGGLP